MEGKVRWADDVHAVLWCYTVDVSSLQSHSLLKLMEPGQPAANTTICCYLIETVLLRDTGESHGDHSCRSKIEHGRKQGRLKHWTAVHLLNPAVPHRPFLIYSSNWHHRACFFYKSLLFKPFQILTEAVFLQNEQSSWWFVRAHSICRALVFYEALLQIVAKCSQLVGSQLWSLFVLHWYFLKKKVVSDVSKGYNTCRNIFLSQLKIITFYQNENIFKVTKWKPFWSSVSLLTRNISSG